MFGGELERFQQLDVWWRTGGVSRTRCLLEDWRGFNNYMFGGLEGFQQLDVWRKTGGVSTNRCLAVDWRGFNN